METENVTSSAQQQQEFSPELLRMFYGESTMESNLVGLAWPECRSFSGTLMPLRTARLFPYAQMFRWLSYGNGEEASMMRLCLESSYLIS
jgi:hypothetical protein